MRPLQSRLAGRLPFYYGWVIFGSVIGIAYSTRTLMATATLSVFLVPMTEQFGWSRGLFSGAVSLGGLAAVIISPFVGRVIDRYGSGVVLATISTISAICAIGIALISQAWAFYAFYVPGRAVFAGPLELGTSVTISNWFVRRRRLAFSLLSMGQGTGLAIMPLVAQFIIVGWGWRVSWASLALYTLAIGVLPPLLLMARRPEDMGMEPDGSSRDRVAGPEPDAPPTQPGSTGSPPAIDEINLTVREALHTRAFWLLSLFSVAGFMVQAGVSLHQVPHFINQGLSGPLAALTASVFAISQTLGAITWAVLANRIPVRFLLCLAAFTAAAGTIGIVSSSTLAGDCRHPWPWGSPSAVFTCNCA